MLKKGSMCFLCLCMAAGSVIADITIIISEIPDNTRSIAIVPFGWNGSEVQPKHDLANVISNDLRISGMFRPISRGSFQATPVATSKINYHNWRLIKAENLIVGQVSEINPATYKVDVVLYDVYRQKELVRRTDQIKKINLRTYGHRLADLMFEELTGIPGAFATRLMYVSHVAGSKKYILYVADADGDNEQQILESQVAILSPSWAKDGRHIAYALLIRGRWEIQIQDIFAEKGDLKLLSDIHPALAKATSISAPSWSPDGKRLAFAMSKNNNFDIYVAGLQDGYFKRVTTHYGIDTEPSWMPDGKSIVFTSGRGGTPQLYQKNINGGKAKRLTFEGNYNAKPSVSPDGKKIAFVHGRKNSYYIALLDVSRGAFNIIAKGNKTLYESPSFAPNGQMIIYTASEQKGRYQETPLKVVSVDGTYTFFITGGKTGTKRNDILEPAWSNFISN